MSKPGTSVDLWYDIPEPSREKPFNEYEMRVLRELIKREDMVFLDGEGPELIADTGTPQSSLPATDPGK
jgi:hypothetical protein